jgi:ribosomal protein S18 acetylase RimI-like enzyme
VNLSYKEDYWGHPELKAEFIGFLKQIHGLDLSLWDEMGYWDHKYRPFSFFDGNALVSNVCVYSMDMTIRGKQSRVAQISAVGTRPEYRGKGLNLELTQKALEWARDEHDFFFLFADTEAFGFYKKCGFRYVSEYKTSVSISDGTAIPGAKKLDVQRKDHRELIYRLARGRAPVSDIIGVFNPKLFMFWCLYLLKDHIHYIPELDLLVLYKRDNGGITIFDIVGGKIPEFSDIYPYTRGGGDEIVEFLFMADKLKLESSERVRIDENGTHLLGDFPLEDDQIIFPLTAHA